MIRVYRVLALLISGLLWAHTGAAQDRSAAISGRVVFEGSAASCSMMEIELETAPMQRIETAYLDSSCNFEFRSVMPGTYYIHLNAEGFQEVRQQVQSTTGFGSAGQIIVFTSPAPERVTRPPDSGNPYVVDASEFLDVYPKSAVNLYREARENARKGRADEAIAQLEKAIAIAPDFYHAHNDVGILYKQAGRFDDAERAFQRAHELNRSADEPLINLSSLYIEEEDPERAVEVSEKAVRKNGRSAPAFFNLGVALYKLSRLDLAEDALKKALELAPSMKEARLALVNLYMKLRRVDRVLEQLNGYLAENPDAENREQIEQLRQQILNSSGTPPQQ